MSLKQYRYTGKERDEETGFAYHGARYYAAWLGRWISADPAGVKGGVNAYEYTYDNPLRYVDADGRQPAPEPPDPDVPPPVPSFDDEGFKQLERLEVAITQFENDLYRTRMSAAAQTQSKGGGGFWSRVWGAVKVIGGSAIAAAACAGTVGVGCVIGAAVGAGMSGAGVVQVVSGEETRNPLEEGASKGLQAFGVSEDTADLITQSAESGYSLAVGVHSIRSADPTRAVKTESNPTAPPTASPPKVVDPVTTKGSDPISSTPGGANPRFAGTSQGDIVINPGVGLSRELRVAEIVGGRVAKVKNDVKYDLLRGEPVKVKGKYYDTLRYPSKEGVKIDVLGPNRELIVVGGPAKAIKLSDLGGNLKRLKELADAHGVKALAYFEAGTPQSVIDVAIKWLGKENVRIFQ